MKCYFSMWHDHYVSLVIKTDKKDTIFIVSITSFKNVYKPFSLENMYIADQVVNVNAKARVTKILTL